MFSFEGEYRRKPNQSLGGSSRKTQKTDLLQQSKAQREERERLRKDRLSAIKIQSFYRSYRVRTYQKKLLRDKFDEIQPRITINAKASKGAHVIDDIFKLAQQLVFFHNEQLDRSRLAYAEFLECYAAKVAVSEMLAQHSCSVKFTNTQWTHILCKVLSLCLRCLSRETGNALPVPLINMIEIFTSPKYWQEIKQPELFGKMIHHLVNKGYFQHAVSFTKANVPEQEKYSSAPPTGSSQFALDLFLNALYISNLEVSPGVISPTVLEHFIGAVLTQPYSSQIHLFIVPALAARPKFPFSQLVTALSSIDLPNQCSASLLYSVSLLAEGHLGKLEGSAANAYFKLLSGGFPVEWEISKSDEHDWEEDTRMETPSERFLRTSFLKNINGIRHVKAAISCLRQSLGTDTEMETTTTIMKLCHNLMFHLGSSVHSSRLLYSIAFNRSLMRQLWDSIVKLIHNEASGSFHKAALTLTCGSSSSLWDVVPMVSIFCSLCHHSLASIHDSNFYGDQRGDVKDVSQVNMFTLPELEVISGNLKFFCMGLIELALPDVKPSLQDGAMAKFFLEDGQNREKLPTLAEYEACWREWTYLFRISGKLIKHLYERDSRKQFCSNNHWLSSHTSLSPTQSSQLYSDPEIFEKNPLDNPDFAFSGYKLEERHSFLSTKDMRILVLLLELPFVIPFENRIQVFHNLTFEDNRSSDYFHGGTFVNIRRNYLYEDAFEKFSSANVPDMRQKVRVIMHNQAGATEAGVDGGGLFREFLSDLLKTGFDANRGLFKSTPDHLLYPNPGSVVLLENYSQHYHFLGRMLGKALYERMLVELPFAGFFLFKILSKNESVDFQHLATLDPELYKSLLYLKTYTGDVADLGLDFTATTNMVGVTRTEELKAGGSDITVTEDNRIEYIHLMANYKLNKQIRLQTLSFQSGLGEVINLRWFSMFNAQELQMMISGTHASIDIQDLQAHANYSGGYSEDHKTIQYFWNVVEGFSDKQKRLLLKFVTSCSRQPLLGFKELYPVFCIHHGGMEDRLPSASTCMNLLKLPEYGSEEVMKERLTYAIESGAGFELS